MTLFASGGTANTFDYRVSAAFFTKFLARLTQSLFQSGDVAYVPPSYGHYIENTGNTTLTYLELFNSGMSSLISISRGYGSKLVFIQTKSKTSVFNNGLH